MQLVRINRLGLSNRTLYDPAAVAWADSVVANGGWVSAQTLGVASTFIRAERAWGNWDLTADYLPLWGENVPQCLTSLKLRLLATAFNSPSFTANRGVTGDSSTSYIDTNFSPATHGAGLMAADNLRWAAYERVTVGGSGATLGVNNTSNRAFHMRGSGATSAVNGQAASFTLPGVVAGFTSGARRGPLATDQVGFKNGVAMPRAVDAAALGATLPTATVFVCCLNNAGTPAIFRASQIGFAVYGASLSDAQELAQFANVQAWATAIGAQI